MAPPLDAIFALASGVLLALLGGALLLVQPRKAPQVFFGLFAVLWGAQVVAANVGRVAGDAPLHAAALLVSYALHLPAFLFLTYFAARIRPGRAGDVLTLLFGGVAVVASLVLVVQPGLVVERATQLPNGRLATALGEAANPLFRIPFFAAFYVALAILYLEYRAVAPGSSRHRVRGLLLALALFTAYQTAGGVLAGFAPAGEPAGSLLGAPLRGAFFLAGALFLVGLVAHLLLRPPPPEERDPALAAAFLVPAAVALLEPLLFPALTQPTVGLWRIATVTALAYALARHQLFDLDVRLKRIAGPTVATLAVAVGAVVSLTLGITGANAASAALPLVGAVAVAGFAYAGRDRLGGLLFPAARNEPDYLYQRKLEVYRAELEKVLAETGKEDAPSLETLRRKLDLTDREHQVMLFLLRNAPAPAVPAPAGLGPGARVLSRYRIDRLLGEGGHGRAFLAYDEAGNEEVVVKAVSMNAFGGRAASLLLREARLLQGLRHPNVIAIRDVGELATDVVIVMEFARGGSLANRLARGGPLGQQAAAEALDGILAGLEAAHAKGIVHRDVKPENLLLGGDGTVKLADFGIARENGQGTALPGTALAVTAGAAAGTLLYMAPEQVRGLPADERSDLYAAAVVYHQLLTGRFYLRIAGKDDFQVREAILRTEPRLDGKDLPAGAEAFLRKALAKDPAARFQTAAEMREALRGALPVPSVSA
ncbi:MAG TPA: serine/threonine-protein kinase [Candidatus Thermoplasmatota archaeon]|nr:serine/threonine-protein kinase [Candidatus Thermoplasmatota archaeon]